MSRVEEESVSKKYQASNPWHWREWFALFLLMVSIWVPRVLKLKEFVTIDEPLWVTRSGNFYCALSKGNFSYTFQREHPGVTTMWVGLLGFLWESPDYIINCPDDVEEQEHEGVLRGMGFDPLALLAAGRFFSILAVTIILVLGFLYARRLLGFWPAWVGFLLIAFDPFHAAISHFLHIDGLSSSFILLTLLAFLCYQHEHRLRDLVVSGIAAGLSCLAKSPGFFLFPFIGLLALLDLAKNWTALRNTRTVKQIGIQFVWPLFLWGLVAMGIFTLLWPSMWVDPVGTLARVFDKANHYASVGHRKPIFFDGQIIENGNLGLEFYYFYPLTYLWRSTPVVLAGLLAAVVAFVKRTSLLEQKHIRHLLVACLLFVLLFTFMMTLAGKKFDRYLLPVYPVLDLVAAVGWVSIAHWLGGIRRLQHIGAFAALGLAVVGQLIPLAISFPYYLSYYNPLLGGGRKAPEVMQIGWGEGLDLAAEYLNAKPGAEQLKVFSWYEPGSFSYFFKGESDGIPARHKLEDVNWGTDFFSSDAYVVTYIHQWQRRESWHLTDYLATQVPEKSIWINGLEYVRIYKLNSHLDFYDAPTYKQADVLLDDNIWLEGYDLPQQEFLPGESILFSLSWRAIETPKERLKIFVHLLNESGELVAQSDGEPMVAFRPTDGWRPDEQIADHYRLELPDDLPAGTYRLFIGMYRATGERLTMTRAGGDVLGDAFVLGEIEVSE